MSENPAPPPGHGSQPPGDDHATGALPPEHSSGTRRFLELRDIPARIGPYRVVRELGHGGMGSVILALREGEEMQRHVAIKLVKRGMDTREILKRFEVERKVIGSLSHPNIARVLDAGATEDGRPYFVMEYVQGQPIDEYCDSQQLTARERLVLFIKVCAAVQYAHQNLIVHRDLKPGNILVSPDGEPKLVDFGIAKMLNPDLAGFTLDTLPEARVMTPEYASPEQVKGEPISTASDIYSMGVLLYELMTGRRPYQIRSRVQAEIERIVCEEEPDRPSTAVTRPAEVTTSDGQTRTITAEEIGRRREMAPTKLRRALSGDIDNIILMAMRKSPRRRYTSAEQFAHDIENHLHDRPVIAAPETWHYHFGKFVVRNRVPVAAVAAVIVALGAGLTGTFWQMQQARAARNVAVRNAELAAAAEKKTQAKYEQLRDFAGDFMTGTETIIQRTEGGTAIRKVTVDTARAVLEKLQAEGVDDPKLVRMLADSLDRLGMVVGGGRSANEGQPQDAIAFFRKSVQLRRSIVAQSPEDPTAAIDLADGLEHLAFVLNRANAAKEADTLLAESRELTTKAAATDGPHRPAAQRQLSRVLTAQGDRRLESAKADEAEPLYREALSIVQALADGAPEGSFARADLQREVGVAHNKLGRLHEHRHNTEAALEEYRKSLAIREALFAAAPTNATNRRDVVVMSDKVARLLLGLNRDVDAEAVLQKALTAAGDYPTQDPDDKRFAGTAARLIELAGDIAVKRQNYEDAVTRFNQYVSRMREIYGPTPDDSQVRYYLSRGVLKLGQAQVDAGRGPEGIENMRRAVAAYADIADRTPDNAIMRLEHARAARRLGDATLKVGRAEEAVDPLTASVASYQIAADEKNGAKGLSSQDREDLAEALAALSGIAQSQNAPQRALDYARRARDTAPADPSDRVQKAIDLAQKAPDRSK